MLRPAKTLIPRMTSFWMRGYTPDEPISLEMKKRWLGQVTPEIKQTAMTFKSDLDSYRREVEGGMPGEYSNIYQTPEGTMTMVMMIDQLPRVIYDNTPAAFEFEDHARLQSYLALEKDWIFEITEIERALVLFPIIRAESDSSVEAGISLLDDNYDAAPRAYRPFLADLRKYAVSRLDVLKRFGRYPLRNAILNRQSTPEEQEYLASLRIPPPPPAPFHRPYRRVPLSAATAKGELDEEGEQ